MQDWKNNAGASRDDGKRQNEQERHPFDLEMRRRLDSAKVTPPASLMDKMFDALENQSDEYLDLKVERGLKIASDGQHKSISTPRRYRFRIGRVAAVAGLLIILSVGMKELVDKNSVIIRSSPISTAPALQKNVTAVQNGDRQSPVPDTGDKGNSALRKTASLSKGLGSIESSGKVSSKPMMPKASVRSQVAAIQTGTEPASRPAGNLAMIKPMVPPQHDPQVLVGSSNLTDQEAPVLSTQEPLAVTSKLIGANKPQSAMAQSVVPMQVKGDVAALATETGEDNNGSSRDEILVRSEELPRPIPIQGQARRERPNRTVRSQGGLLKGIFKKLGSGARTITKDIVSSDEDKTVINLGILAITTYK